MGENAEAALDTVTAGVADLLLDGRAITCAEAEAMYLDAHLAEVAALARSGLSYGEFRRHPLIVLLMSHGSRGWEDSLASLIPNAAGVYLQTD